MIRSIHVARGLDRLVAELRRSGKKGELAVMQFEKIVGLLRLRGPEAMELLVKRTKHGEWRIRNCIKYDLGSGYRLITICIEDRLYIPFLGDHDESDLWLERHKNDGFLPLDAIFRDEPIAIPVTDGSDEAAGDQPANGEDPYEKQLQAKLDESLLKTVFQGLYQ